VIKSKVLRLKLPAEVKAEESKAQRSTVTGHLVVTMPKVNPRENMVSAIHFELAVANEVKSTTSKSLVRTRKALMSQMLDEGSNITKIQGAVKIDGMIPSQLYVDSADSSRSLWMSEVGTTRKRETADEAPSAIESSEDDDNDEPPPFS